MRCSPKPNGLRLGPVRVARRVLSAVFLPVALSTVLLTALPGGAGAETVDFLQAFAAAEKFHESIGAAREQARQRGFEKDKVLAQLLPSLSADSSLTRRPDTLSSGAFTLRPRQSWEASLRLRQALFTGGRASTQLKVATIGKESGKLGVLMAREQLLFSLAESWFQVQRARENLITIQERHEGMLRHLAAARARVALGAAVRASALRLEAEVAQLAAQQLGAEDELISAREEFATLSGLPVDTELGNGPDLSAPGLPTSGSSATTSAQATSVESSALETRTDIGLLAGETAATALGVRYASGTFLPFVKAEAVYQKRGEDPSSSFFLDTDKYAMLTATWDLFSGGENFAERRRARAAFREKSQQLDQREREVAVEVRQAQRSAEVSTRIVEALNSRVEYAGENHRIVTETHKAGAATYLDVIDASNALGDARRDLAGARYNQSMAKLQLARATGRLLLLVGEPAPDLSRIHRWLHRYTD